MYIGGVDFWVWICICELNRAAGYFYYMGKPSTKPQTVEWLDVFFPLCAEGALQAALLGQAFHKTQALKPQYLEILW